MNFLNTIKKIITYPKYKLDEWREKRKIQKELKEKRKKTKFIYK